MLPVEEAVKKAFDNSELVPQFTFLDQSSNNFSLLRLQCKGELIANPINGVQNDNEAHYNMCKNTLKKARETYADILLTPEYCIPWQLVEEIVQDRDLQPDYGKLWVLCCQGIQSNRFQEMMQNFKESHYVVMPSDVSYKYFVNVLLYIFQSAEEEGKLVIIPQLKLQPMRDTKMSHEGAGLTQGHTIYMFGRNSNNQLCSIICADAYDNRIIQNLGLFNQTWNEHWIILHPQLNPKPRHDGIIGFRKSLFNITGERNIVYITANWAEGTIIELEGEGEEKINNPWSCIYLKHTNGNWLQELRDIRKLNFSNGLAFCYVQKLKKIIWYAIKYEHLMQLRIVKPLQGGQGITISNDGVRTEFTYKYHQSKWIESNKTFDDQIPSGLLESFTGNFSYPVDATDIELRDKFFGLCLGQMETGQLVADENTEITNRLSIHVDQECEICKEQEIDKIRELTSYLHNPSDGLPEQMKHLNGNFMYHYDDSFEFYNLYPLVNEGTPGDGKKGVWVSFEYSEKKAKSLANKLMANAGKEREDKICVFTISKGKTIAYPKYNVQFNANSRAESIVNRR